jgi:RNA polymerase sigma-70 factor (ECF subfamily)
VTDPASGGKCRLEVVRGTKPHPEQAGPGEPPSLADVYRAHVDFVYRTARHLGVPDSEVEDVMHDVFLVVHRRLADYDESRATMRSWLYGITRRVTMQHHRSRARTARRLAAVPEDTPPPAVDEQVERSRAVEAVERFLETLATDQRIAFALVEIEGMTAPEISRAEGVKLNTVYSRLRAARRKLQRFLAALQRGGDDG